jgi:hypothetical protein
MHMTQALDLTYPAILSHLRQHIASGRTETRSFLAWFLEHYYRLEGDEAQDSVCDGPDDKGVDGIYADENFERIDILQSKLYQNPTKTLGDTQLKEFAGTLAQFRAPDSITAIIEGTGNRELASLLKQLDVKRRIEDGWDVRGVFVTNAAKDTNADACLEFLPDIRVFDQDDLLAGYVASGPSGPMATPAEFDVSGFDVVEYRTPDATAFIAPLLGSELLKLDGIQSGELFSWNVRQSLGRTKVNKAIAQSVREQTEHKNFVLYHNGLTVLCESVSHDDGKLKISGYTVVNGCQSLTTLFENRSSVSSELRILTRLIQLPPDSELAAKITRHSNNQNAIHARDLQSNSTIQRRIQSEITALSDGKTHYEIKRGDSPSGIDEVITNEEAARILLAFDRQEPWSCHQTYRLFDDLHSHIFARPEVTGERILALHQAYDAVVEALDSLNSELMAKYRLTRFFLLYLLRRVLETDEEGKKFCRSPELFLREADGAGRIKRAVAVVLQDVVVDVNAEMEEREQRDNVFDYKRELKSVNAVRVFAKQVVPMYEKALRRGRVTSFGEGWSDSENAG